MHMWETEERTGVKNYEELLKAHNGGLEWQETQRNLEFSMERVRWG